MKNKSKIIIITLLLMVLGGCKEETAIIDDEPSFPRDTAFDRELLPEYAGYPYVFINDNQPFFDEDDLKKAQDTYEEYGPLDELGRCTYAVASIDESLFPTKERGDISAIKPTGWKQVIDEEHIQGGSLYTRSHLIAHQLTGEDANANNLITGTRFMNEDGMIPFEHMVADAVEEAPYHILYRVTPIFEGDDLVAQGVLLESMSVEDEGDSLSFCAYVYNIQPCFTIAYEDGESAVDESCAYTQNIQGEAYNDDITYVINVHTGKFHLPDCENIHDIYSGNRLNYYGDKEFLIEMGYQGCKTCNP